MDAITELAGAAMGGVQGGRDCDACGGHGEFPTTIGHSPDTWEQACVPCERCGGTGERRDDPTPLVILGQGDYQTTIEE